MRLRNSLWYTLLGIFIGLWVGFCVFLLISDVGAATPTPVPVSALTPVTTVTPASLLYIVQDPDGTPVSRRASVEAAVDAIITPFAPGSVVSDLYSDLDVTGSVTASVSISSPTVLVNDLTVYDSYTGPVSDHAHAGVAGDGGQLEADEVLLATDIITDYVLSAVGDGSVEWAEATGGGLTSVTAVDVDSEGATDGYVLTSDGADGADWEEVIGSTENPSVMAYRSTDQTVAHNTATSIAFDTENWDSASIHSTVDATERFTATVDGIYMGVGHVVFPYDGDGIRLLYIKRNGTTVGDLQVGPTGGSSSTRLCLTSVFTMTSGDYATFDVYHNAVDSLNIDSVASYSPSFALTRLRALP